MGGLFGGAPKIKMPPPPKPVRAPMPERDIAAMQARTEMKRKQSDFGREATQLTNKTGGGSK
jgi:hypothetical protein